MVSETGPRTGKVALPKQEDYQVTTPIFNKPRVLSGIQPSGTLHLGNYLGALRNWVEEQDQYENFFCIVDYHAMTVRHLPAELRQRTLELANIYFSCGLDPEQSTIFVQSHVAEHTELAWIFNCVATKGELSRMTQFKDKRGTQKEESVGVGLFTYPLLMAADITIYDANFVPVGEDQRQHVELTRDLAERFNSWYGETLVVPKPLIREAGARIMGLDNPQKKMSKSASSSLNYIALNDSPDTIRQKIKKAVTDSGSEIKADPDKPALSNLLTIYSLCGNKPVSELEEHYVGKGYGIFKMDLAEAIITVLEPIQQKLQALEEQPERSQELLRQGAERARRVARATLARVRQRLGLLAP